MWGGVGGGLYGFRRRSRSKYVPVDGCLVLANGFQLQGVSFSRRRFAVVERDGRWTELVFVTGKRKWIGLGVMLDALHGEGFAEFYACMSMTV